MDTFQLSAERVHLLQKVARKERDPIEIVICTAFAILFFLWVYLWTECRLRHDAPWPPLLLGVGLGFVACCGLTSTTYKKIKEGNITEKRSLWVNLTACAWVALVAGYLCGDYSFWKYTTNIYSYRDLVSYVDIDPEMDKGQAFMDSGYVYFKENSRVHRRQFTKFTNADVYCVAPIVGLQHGVNIKQVAAAELGVQNSQATAGSIASGPAAKPLPLDETYDWWAVGKNCCDPTGTTSGELSFNCGEVDNTLARSGKRLLSDNERPYYLMAVQQWSATYNKPVKHPLFFTWVKDPLEDENRLGDEQTDLMWNYLLHGLVVFLVLSFIIHWALRQHKIY